MRHVGGKWVEPWGSLGQRIGPLLPWGLSAIWLVAMVFWNGRRLVYEADRDEGFNFMMTLLVERGYSAYHEIWNDQPPGFLYLSWAFVSLFGHAPETARILVLGLAALLLAALADQLRREFSGWRGAAAATGACLALCFSTDFLRSAATYQIGLPAIALATCSGWLSSLRRGPRFDGASGVLFAGSLYIKVFTLPLLVGVVAAMAAAELGSGFRRSNWRHLALRLGPFGLGLGAALTVAFAPYLIRGAGDSLWATHVAARGHIHGESVPALLRDDLWIFCLGLPGLAWGLGRRSPLVVGAVSASVSSVVALLLHSPVWTHHRYLFLVPWTLVVGSAFGATLAAFPLGSSRFRTLRISAAMGTCALLAFMFFSRQKVAGVRDTFRRGPPPRPLLAVEAAVRRSAPGARTAVTSRQMYAYRLGLPVPPALAMTSSKRFSSGELDCAKLSEMVKDAHPDVMILDSRWPGPCRKRLLRAARREYQEVYRNQKNLDVRVLVKRS